MKMIEGHLDGKGLKVGIVVSRFNDFVCSRLQDGAVDGLVRHGVNEADITIVKVPGSFEIPMVAAKLASAKTMDAIICLGAVIRGATPHFEYVSAQAAKGVAHVAQNADIPVIFGVLTVDTLDQAVERAVAKMGNKGFTSSVSAIEMANLLKIVG